MAIYHLSGKIISRSAGRSSVAASAYRAAEKIVDERTGLTHDFQMKNNDLIYKEILTPDGAPSWMQNRETLWNHIESIEKRKDATLAREFVISLPKELTNGQNILLTKEFVQTQFVERGMVADVCIHQGHKAAENQPHAHVMLSMRELANDGFGKKERSWNDKKLLFDWREKWAQTCNHHLQKNGFDIQIDHRTLADQGIDLEPQTKIGPNNCKYHIDKTREHQEIAQRNGERILSEPSIAFKSLTAQYATFTHQDLARFVHRHSGTSEQFSEIFELLKTDIRLVELGRDDAGRLRYSTEEMLDIEQSMMNDVQALAKKYGHLTDTFNQRAQLSSTKVLNGEQQYAYKNLMQGSDITCIVGFAGSGKSTLLGSAREAWADASFSVTGMSLSGIAAQNLEGASGIKSYTIASKLWSWGHDREHLNSKSIVVVDEAGMVGTKQMGSIVSEVKQGGAKLVLVGDPEQLQAIDAGGAFRGIIERTGYVGLTNIYRQVEPWQQQATRDFALARTHEGLKAYDDHYCIHGYGTQAQAMSIMVEAWEETRAQSPDKTQLLLAYTRLEVKALNDRVRGVLQAQGELKNEKTIETSRGKRSFAIGDRIYFLRNEKSLAVKNGSLGVIEAIEKHGLKVKLDNNKSVDVNLDHYNHIDHGYAATIHKAQGVSVDKAFVLASPYFNRHSTYVAMSRHRESAELFYSHEMFVSAKSLDYALSRQALKDLTLDYAEHRGLDVPGQTKETPHDNWLVSRIKEGVDAVRTRVEGRAQVRAMNKAIKALEKRFDKPISTDVHAGEHGIHRGVSYLGEKSYHVIEKDNVVKILPLEKNDRALGAAHRVVIEKRGDGERLGLRAQEEKSSDINREKAMDKTSNKVLEKDFEIEL